MYGQETSRQRRSFDDIAAEVDAEFDSPKSARSNRPSFDDIARDVGADSFSSPGVLEKPVNQTVKPKPLTTTEKRFAEAGRAIRDIEGRKQRAVSLFQEADRTPDTAIESIPRAQGSALPLLDSANKPVRRKDALRAQAEGELEIANQRGKQAQQKFGDLIEVGYGDDADKMSNRKWVYAKPRNEAVEYYRRPGVTERAAQSTREEIDRDVRQQQRLKDYRGDYEQSGALSKFAQRLGTGYLSERPDLTPDERDELQIQRKARGMVEQPEPGFGEDFTDRVMRGALDVIPSGVAGAANIADTVYRGAQRITGNRLPEAAEWGPTAERWARDVSNTVAPFLPIDPKRNEDFSSKLAGGVGSAAGFGAASKLAALARVSTPVAVGTVGAGVGADEIVREAREAGFDPAQDPARWDRMVALGGASGMTEIFGFGKMLDRWGLKRQFTKRAMEVLEEGGQEALQQFLGNVNAAYVGQYDKTRPLTNDVLENAIIGGIVGGGTQAADVVAERMARTPQQNGDSGQTRPPEATVAPIVSITPPVAPQTPSSTVAPAANQPPAASQQSPIATAPAPLFPDAQQHQAPQQNLSALDPQQRVAAMLDRLRQQQEGRKAASLEQQLNAEFAEAGGMIDAAGQNWDADRATAEQLATTGAARLKSALQNLQKSESFATELGAVASGTGQPGPYMAAAQALQAKLEQAQGLFGLDAEREREAQRQQAEAEKAQRKAEKEAQKQARFAAREEQKQQRQIAVEQQRAAIQQKRDEAVARRLQAAETAKEARRAQLHQQQAKARDEKAKKQAEGELQRIALHDAALKAADDAGRRHQEYLDQGNIADAINELIVQQNQIRDAVKYLPRTPESQNTKADLNRYQGQIGNRIGDLRAQMRGRRAPVTQGVPPLLQPGAVVNPEGGVPEQPNLADPGAKFFNGPLADVNQQDAAPLLTAIRRLGGIQDDGQFSGEMRQFANRESGTTGIVNGRTGLKPDRMREALVEEGLLPEDATVDDMFQAMRQADAAARSPRQQETIDEFYERWAEEEGETEGQGDREDFAETANNIPENIPQSGGEDIPEGIDPEEWAAYQRTLARSNEQNPRPYNERTRSAEPGSGGVSMSGYAVMLSRHGEKIDRLREMNLNSPEAQQIIAEITEDNERMGVEHNRGHLTPHIDALIAQIQNEQFAALAEEDQQEEFAALAEQKSIIRNDIEERAALSSPTEEERIEAQLYALDQFFDSMKTDSELTALFDAAIAGDNDSLFRFAEVAEVNYGLDEDTAHGLITSRRQAKNQPATRTADAASRSGGTRSDTAENQERWVPPDASEPTAAQLSLLRSNPTNVPDADYDQYLGQLETLYLLAEDGRVAIDPSTIYNTEDGREKNGRPAPILVRARAERHSRREANRLPSKAAVRFVAEYGDYTVEQLVGLDAAATKKKSRLSQILNTLSVVLEKRPTGVSPAWAKRLQGLYGRGQEALQRRPGAPTAREVNVAANEAATSPKNDLPQPTDAQKEAGNYKMGHVNIHGLDVTIELPAGGVRSGKDQSGKEWEVKMTAHYGYLKRSTGADGEHFDVYIGKNPASDRVFVVDQINLKDGKFDEHKAILGTNSLAEAQALYDAHFSDGKGAQRRGAVTEMSVDEFREWVKDGEKTKPLALKKNAPESRPLAEGDRVTWTNGGKTLSGRADKINGGYVTVEKPDGSREVLAQKRLTRIEGVPEPMAAKSDRSVDSYWKTQRIERDETGQIRNPQSIIPDSRAEFRQSSQGAGTLWLNEQATLVIGAAAVEGGVTLGSERGFMGVAMSLPSVRKTLVALRARAEQYGARIDAIANALEEAMLDAVANHQRAVVMAETATQTQFNQRKQTIREERYHQWQQTHGLLTIEIADQLHDALAGDSTYQQIQSVLLDPQAERGGYRNDPAILITEAAAKMASGQWQEYGVESEAEGLNFLHRYMRAAVEKVGPHILEARVVGTARAQEVFDDVREIKGLAARNPARNGFQRRGTVLAGNEVGRGTSKPVPSGGSVFQGVAVEGRGRTADGRSLSGAEREAGEVVPLEGERRVPLTPTPREERIPIGRTEGGEIVPIGRQRRAPSSSFEGEERIAIDSPETETVPLGQTVRAEQPQRPEPPAEALTGAMSYRQALRTFRQRQKAKEQQKNERAKQARLNRVSLDSSNPLVAAMRGLSDVDLDGELSALGVDPSEYKTRDEKMRAALLAMQEYQPDVRSDAFDRTQREIARRAAATLGMTEKAARDLLRTANEAITAPKDGREAEYTEAWERLSALSARELDALKWLDSRGAEPLSVGRSPLAATMNRLRAQQVVRGATIKNLIAMGVEQLRKLGQALGVTPPVSGRELTERQETEEWAHLLANVNSAMQKLGAPTAARAKQIVTNAFAAQNSRDFKRSMRTLSDLTTAEILTLRNVEIAGDYAPGDARSVSFAEGPQGEPQRLASTMNRMTAPKRAAAKVQKLQAEEMRQREQSTAERRAEYDARPAASEVVQADLDRLARLRRNARAIEPVAPGRGGNFNPFAPQTTPLRSIVTEHQPMFVDPLKLQEAAIEQVLKAGAAGTLPGARALHWANKLKLKSAANKLANRQANFIQNAIEKTDAIIAASDAMQAAKPGSDAYKKARAEFYAHRRELHAMVQKTGEYAGPVEYLAKYGKAALLSAPHILTNNVLDHLASFPFHEAQKLMGFLLPVRVLQRWGVDVERTHVDFRDLVPAMAREFKAILDGTKDAGLDFVNMLRYGTTDLLLDEEIARQQVGDLDEDGKPRTGGADRYDFGKAAKGVPGMDQVIGAIGRTHGAVDVVGRRWAFTTALVSQADAIAQRVGRENGLGKDDIAKLRKDLAAEPSPQMIVLAMDEANRFVLDYPTFLYELLQKSRQIGKDKYPGVSKAWNNALDFVVKFQKIPLAAQAQSLWHYTPMGLANQAVRVRRAAKAKAAGKPISKQESAEIVERLQQGALGSLMWAGAGLLGSLGYLQFTGGDDRERVRNAEEALGYGYDPELMVGDVGVKLNRFGTFGRAGSVAARLVKAAEQRKDVNTGETEPENARLKRISKAAMKGVVLDNPVGRGVGELFASDIGDPVENFARGQIRSLQPGILREIAKVADEKKRIPDDNSFTGKIVGDFKTGNPWMRQTQQPRLNALGREFEEENPFLPFRRVKSDPLLEEMARLGTGPAKPRRERGETGEEYNRRVVEQGRQTQKAMRRIANDPDQAGRSDEAKARIYSSELMPISMRRASKLSEDSIETERDIEALRANAYEAVRQLPAYQQLKDSDKEKVRSLIDDQLKGYRARSASKRSREKAARLPEFSPVVLARLAVANAGK